MKRPECLHIPPLYEGESAQINWGVVESDANYIVERNFNESFLQALSGYTWDNYDTTNESWSKYDQEFLNWYQIENRTGKGQTWERLDYEQLSWPEIENKSHTWQQFESQKISFEIYRGPGAERNNIARGLTWLELDELRETWENKEAMGYSWTERELRTLPGLSWDCIEARCLSFEEWEQQDLTFYELEMLRSATQHRGMDDFVPIGAKTAMYRIKAYNSGGDESDYLTTSQLPIIPIFYRDSHMEYPVKAGKRYRILLKAQDVHGLDRVRMNLRYNSHLLELTNFAAQSQRNILKPGNYSEEQLNIYSSFPGKVWFQSTKTLNQNECFSGSITLVEFVAKGNGRAMISLS